MIREFARWMTEPDQVVALQLEIGRLSKENLRLRTIMMAAYQEIVEHWDAHCNPGGFGPQNLTRHLKEGTGHYPGYVNDVITQEKGSTSDTSSES